MTWAITGYPLKIEQSSLNYSMIKAIEYSFPSEYELEDEFKKYELETNIDEIHDVLSAADFFIGGKWNYGS